MNAGIELTPVQLRVLGALMEKSVTTPEYYPLTLNGLIAASNQKTSREPVMELDEDEVLGALDALRDMRLALRVDFAGSRVAKFRQNVNQLWELSAAEFAVLTVLILRGGQTPGQIRSRTERLYGFASLEALHEVMEGLERRELEPTVLIKALPRRPGIKEVRYGHVLGGEVDDAPEELLTKETAEPDTVRLEHRSELEALRAEVDRLTEEVAELKAAFEQFKGQF